MSRPKGKLVKVGRGESGLTLEDAPELLLDEVRKDRAKHGLRTTDVAFDIYASYDKHGCLEGFLFDLTDAGGMYEQR